MSPFKSAKQRRFLFAKKPAVAKKFAAHSGKKSGSGGSKRKGKK